MASLYDNSLCRPASRPNYFSGLRSANKSHGLGPSRILPIYAVSPAASFSSFVVRHRRVENYFALTKADVCLDRRTPHEIKFRPLLNGLSFALQRNMLA